MNNRNHETGATFEHLKSSDDFSMEQSEVRTQEDLFARLSQAFLDASGIEVKFTNGTATLSGTVEDAAAKRLAVDIIGGAPRVTKVDNQLTIKMLAQPSNEVSSSTRARNMS